MAEERRKNKRTDMPSVLTIKKLGGGGNSEEISIRVSDVSKTGIGFISTEALQIGEVYESHIPLWTKEVLHAFLRIVRIEMMDDNEYSYGALFIGMPEVDLARIEVYQTVNEKQ